MQKFIVMVGLAGVLVGGGYGQVLPEHMPEDVKRFLENYVIDSTARLGPVDVINSWRRSSGVRGLTEEPVQVKDLKVGRVLEIYQLKHIFLNEIPDTIPFRDIIEPTGYWFVLITAHNKPFCQLLLKNTEGELKFIGMGILAKGTVVANMWEQLLKTYPESTGINPVFFSRYGFTVGIRERILYFEQKGPRKIYHVKLWIEHELAELFPASIETLDDSKKLIEYWKKQGLNEVGIRGTNRTTIGGTK